MYPRSAEDEHKLVRICLRTWDANVIGTVNLKSIEIREYCTPLLMVSNQSLPCKILKQKLRKLGSLSVALLPCYSIPSSLQRIDIYSSFEYNQKAWKMYLFEINCHVTSKARVKNLREEKNIYLKS